MSRFLDALHSGEVLLMDGGMGSELRRIGLGVDCCCEHWNLTHPDRVRAVHEGYKNAGAQFLLTNTFQSNPAALARHGLTAKMEEINRAAVALARLVAGGKGFVLGDIGPIEPRWSEEPTRQVIDSFKGVDAVLFETYSDMDALWMVKYGCLPLMARTAVPVILSITYKKTDDGVVTTHGGQSPEVFARLARQYGVAALGTNCGRDIGMSEVIEIIHRYRKETDLPLFARPNAGTPAQQGNQWVYPQSPGEMASRLSELLEAGVVMVGGCCGTTPAHIAAFRPIIDAWNARLAPGEHI
jgi:5-methyltetrahydrofolate--homocysteine methyltransferase